jgi:hypothetical protein
MRSGSWARRRLPRPIQPAEPRLPRLSRRQPVADVDTFLDVRRRTGNHIAIDRLGRCRQRAPRRALRAALAQILGHILQRLVKIEQPVDLDAGSH